MQYNTKLNTINFKEYILSNSEVKNNLCSTMSSTMVISSFSIIICIIIATLLTTIVLETSAVQPVLDNSVSLQQEFEDWMAVYAKSYTNDTEKNEKKKNWLGNRAFVINHNINIIIVQIPIVVIIILI